MPALGEELSVNAVWRRIRVFRPHGAMLGAAVGATVATLEARGWRQSGPVVTGCCYRGRTGDAPSRS